MINYLDKLPELTTLAIIVYGFIQMHKSDTKYADVCNRIDATSQRIDETNQRIDATNQRIDEQGQRIDALHREIMELIKKLK